MINIHNLSSVTLNRRSVPFDKKANIILCFKYHSSLFVFSLLNKKTCLNCFIKRLNSAVNFSEDEIRIVGTEEYKILIEWCNQHKRELNLSGILWEFCGDGSIKRHQFIQVPGCLVCKI